MGLLHEAGLAQLYLTDVHGLNSLLDAMGQRGMPVDAATRLEAARALAQERQAALAELHALIPVECCPTKIYKRRPTGEATGTVIAVTTTECTYCGARRPNKKHTCWKTQPYNVIERTDHVQHFVVRLPFVPSPKGLLTYFRYKGYALPTKYDRATGQKRHTTDEGALLRMALTHEDPVCAAVLRFRGVDKQLSTYVGRPA